MGLTLITMKLIDDLFKLLSNTEKIDEGMGFVMTANETRYQNDLRRFGRCYLTLQ